MAAPIVRGTKAIRVAYGEALAELGAERDDIVVLDADLAHATTTYVFGEKFPERFFNVGIAEQNMMGVAAGLAISGLTPIASTFSMFGTGRAFEQVRNSICYANLNVTLALTHNGITVGEDGGSHQSVEDIALMRSVPGMTVMVPCDAIEMRKALRTAVDHPGPVYVRVSRPPAPIFTADDAPFIRGKANKLRDGDDVTIIAIGLMVYQSLLAAEELEADGIQATVLNMHTVKPIDRDAIVEAAGRTGRIVTVEDHSVIGGLGSAVAEVVATEAPARLKRLGLQDCFGQSGTPDALAEHYGLTGKHIAAATRQFIGAGQ